MSGIRSDQFARLEVLCKKRLQLFDGFWSKPDRLALLPRNLTGFRAVRVDLEIGATVTIVNDRVGAVDFSVRSVLLQRLRLQPTYDCHSTLTCTTRRDALEFPLGSMSPKERKYTVSLLVLQARYEKAFCRGAASTQAGQFVRTAAVFSIWSGCAIEASRSRSNDLKRSRQNNSGSSW